MKSYCKLVYNRKKEIMAMDFFDKVGDVITSTGKDVVKKAKDIAEAANLKSQISCPERIIDEAYVEIGKAYYEVHKDEENHLYMEQCATISDAMEKISQLNDELVRLKGSRICPKCGTEIDENALFCSNCGTKLEAVKKETEEAEGSEEEATGESTGSGEGI